jgi:hypothetical protein
MTVKDFTRVRERVVFTIGPDTFEAAPALPGQTLTEFALRFSDAAEAATGDKLRIITDALSMVLLPESSALFAKRFADLEQPIELDQASEVLLWLVECYGLRPTQPFSPSASGSPGPGSGTSSMDAAPQPEPASPTSPRAGS